MGKKKSGSRDTPPPARGQELPQSRPREFHPAANILPLMSGPEFEALVEDIKRNGLREAVVLDADDKVIDGRNRLRACEAAGIAPVYRLLPKGADVLAFVVSMNLARRHLDAGQRAAIAAEILPKLKAEARERQREGGREQVREKIPEAAADTGRATEQAAKMLGTNRKYVEYAARLKEQAPEEFEKLKRGGGDPKKAITKLKKEEIREQYRRKGIEVILPPEVRVVQGDFKTYGAEIADGSVDAIITDPPWSLEAIENFSHLSVFAARVLKPGAPLVAYVGNTTLLEAGIRLHRGLRFVGTLAILFDHGPDPRIRVQHMVEKFRPLLLFSKGAYKSRGWIETILHNDRERKDLHPWQQGTAPVEYLIDRLTNPGDLVVDPFSGSCTTLVAALRKGRRAIGFEIDPKHVHIAKGRIAEELERLKHSPPEEKPAGNQRRFRLGELERQVEKDN